MSLLTSLVAYYKFDGNSNDSVGSNNGTNTSIAYSTTHAKINQGADFGGSSKITLGNLGLTNNLSIYGWFYASSYAGFKVLFGKGDGVSASSGSVHVWVNSNKLEFDIPDASVNNVLSCPDTLTNGVLYFFACTYDGTTMKVSVNAGTQYTKAHTGNLNVNSSPTQIGQLGIYYGFTGTIDEFGIKSSALTQAEIIELYNNGAGKQFPYTVTTNANILISLV